MDDTTKTCSRCNQPFPATTEYFHAHKRTKDGLNSWCKVCCVEYQREYYQANQDKRIEYQREYKKANPDKIRAYYQDNQDKLLEYQREYRLANPEKNREWQQANKDKIAEYQQANKETIAEQQREWRQINKDRYSDYQQEWWQSNPEKSRIYSARRRAREQSLPDTFTSKQWLICLEYHHFCCAVCGKQLRDLLGDVVPHADHWIPISSDDCTGTIATNMICLCNNCNLSKHDTMPDIWLKGKFGTRKANIILKRVATYFEWVIHLE